MVELLSVCFNYRCVPDGQVLSFANFGGTVIVLKQGGDAIGQACAYLAHSVLVSRPEAPLCGLAAGA
jgi:hypothetical protein